MIGKAFTVFLGTIEIAFTHKKLPNWLYWMMAAGIIIGYPFAAIPFIGFLINSHVKLLVLFGKILSILMLPSWMFVFWVFLFLFPEEREVNNSDYKKYLKH